MGLRKDSRKNQLLESHPPRWAERLLAWYCKPELLEDLQGDLNEYFDRNLKAKGARRARLIYIIDVLKFFRIYTLRKPQFIHLFTHWLMLGSYLKTSGRTLVRNKLFSAINIIGLAVSMSVGLLMITFLSDMLSYDDFHEKKDRIYRVVSAAKHDPGNGMATTSVRAGEEIRKTVPGIEELSILRRGFGGDAQVEEATLPLSGLWADASFFKVFTFPLLEGDPATALKQPYSLVLTEKSAKKLFGEGDALGKLVAFDTMTYVVTGVMKDIPKFSHMRFDVLASFSTVQLQKPDTDGGFLSWGSIYMNYVYVVLPENGNPQAIQDNLDRICAAENIGNNNPVTLSLQPLKNIALQGRLGNPIGPTTNKVALWILGGLTLIVMLSACFNYTNLSIARSLRRSREVGIRKVIGALKSHVLGQFITESVCFALLALVLAFPLFLFVRTQFLSLAPQLSDMATLAFSYQHILYFMILAVIVGVVAGFLPALFFSRINAIQVLKDASSLRVFRHVNMRKALIVVQYVFSLIFITTTMIGYKQYKGFLTFDLGFNTENILNIRMQGNNSDFFIQELSALPAVNEISKSTIITSVGSKWGMQIKYKDINDSASVWTNYIDEHYLPLHEHEFLAGRNFNPNLAQGEEGEAIVTEKVLKRFNIGQGDPHEALGEQIIVPGLKLTIVGVLKDFHYGTVDDEIQPIVFRHFSDASNGYINVKITSNDLPATLSSIEAIWKKMDHVHPLDATFYDDQIEQNYRQFMVIVKIIGFLAFLTICISSMGLFGMVVFSTETRLREISIRKVMGASEGNLVYLLGKGFLLLLLIAALIALPATYLFFDKVILVNFAYHQPMGWSELLTGTLAVMFIAFLMIGSQTLKVARTNPAEVLKNE